MDINKLVDRFLAWPLPDSVCSDLCATKQGYPHRSGTTLLSAAEAKQMLEYVLTAALTPLAWSSEKPSEPGWYWFRNDSKDIDPALVYVNVEWDEVGPWRHGEDDCHLTDLHGQFAGPVTPPIPPPREERR